MFLSDSASLDLKSRWVLMSAYLYYRQASPVVHDAYYDRLSREVAKGWQLLDPLRQWQLGSPDELLATGHHVKVTVYVEAAALAWHKSVKGAYPEGQRIQAAEWKPDIRCRWTYAEPVGVTVKKQARRKPMAAPRPEQLKLF